VTGSISPLPARAVCLTLALISACVLSGCVHRPLGAEGSLASKLGRNPQLASVVCGFPVEGLDARAEDVTAEGWSFNEESTARVVGRPRGPGARTSLCHARVSFFTRRRTDVLGSYRVPPPATFEVDGVVTVLERDRPSAMPLDGTHGLPLALPIPEVGREIDWEAYLANAWSEHDTYDQLWNRYTLELPAGTHLKLRAACRQREGSLAIRAEADSTPFARPQLEPGEPVELVGPGHFTLRVGAAGCVNVWMELSQPEPARDRHAGS
jgi:hypothetical protein